MKHIKTLLSLSLLFILGTGFSFSQQLMQYTSDRFDYSMKIPEDWKRNDQLKSENLAMVLVSPDDASISVSFYTLKDMEPEIFIENFQDNIEKKLGGNVVEKGVFKARDGEATYLLYDYEKDGKLTREKLSFFPRKKEMAVLTAQQEKSKFHEITPILEYVFSSFTFETKQDKVDTLD